ncbi:hypothetical protein JW766_04155 [Candidatus Dojkabacteria bacterium]|nr:hypothetical protein [Candidatus Dojkabacteria bacterium]
METIQTTEIQAAVFSRLAAITSGAMFMHESPRLLTASSELSNDVAFFRDETTGQVLTLIGGLQVADFQLGFLPESLPSNSELAANYVRILAELRSAPRGTISLDQAAFMLSQVEGKGRTESFHEPNGWKGKLYQLDARQHLLVLILQEIVLHSMTRYGLIEESNEGFKQAIRDNRIPIYLLNRMKVLGRPTPEEKDKFPITFSTRQPEATYDKWCRYFQTEAQKALLHHGIYESHEIEAMQLNVQFAHLLLAGIPHPTPYLSHIAGSLSFDMRSYELGEKPFPSIGWDYKVRYRPEQVHREITLNFDPLSYCFEAISALNITDILPIVERLGYKEFLTGTWLNSGAGTGIALELCMAPFGIDVIHIDRNPKAWRDYLLAGGDPDRFVLGEIANCTTCIRTTLGTALANGFFLVHPSGDTLIRDTFMLVDKFLTPGGLILAIIDQEDERLYRELGFEKLPYRHANCWLYQNPTEVINV